MDISIVTNGQIIIPARIRRKYGIKKGTKIAFIEEGDKVIMQPLNKNYFNKLAGVLNEKGKMIK